MIIKIRWPADMLQARMRQKTLGVEGITGLHGDAVAGLIQGTRRGRTYGREREIAFLIEIGRAEADGVGAGENDDIEILESAQLRRQRRA